MPDWQRITHWPARSLTATQRARWLGKHEANWRTLLRAGRPLPSLRWSDTGAIEVTDRRLSSALSLVRLAQGMDGVAERRSYLIQMLRLALASCRMLAGLHTAGLYLNALDAATLLVDLPRERAVPASLALAGPRTWRVDPELLGTAERQRMPPDWQAGRGGSPGNDLWLLGRLLYECLSGRELLASEQGGVPPLITVGSASAVAVNEALARLCHHSPVHRVADVDVAIAQFEHCLQLIDGEVRRARTAAPRLVLDDELVGREEELAALGAAMADCARGQGPVLMQVDGESGHGKTALVERFLSERVPAHALLAHSCCPGAGRRRPLEPVLDAIAALSRAALSAADWAATPAADAELLIEIMPDLRPHLGERLPPPPLSAEMAYVRLCDALKRLLARSCAGRDCVVWLDDWQWIDAGSLSLLGELLEPQSLPRLLLIVTRRSALGAGAPAERDQDALASLARAFREHHRLRLGGLSAAMVADWIAATLRCGPDVAAALGDLLWEKTGGDPLHCRQLLLALQRDGLLTWSAQAKCWLCDLSAVRRRALTERLLELLERELASLERPELALLRLLACLGASVNFETLSALSESEPLALARSLYRLLRGGWVVRDVDWRTLDGLRDIHEIDEFDILYGPAQRFALVHDRLRQALHQGLSKTHLSTLHASLGRRLVARLDRRAGDSALFDVLAILRPGLGHQYSDAERLELARLYAKGGMRARNYVDFEASLQYFDDGLQLLGSAGWALDRELAFSLALESAQSAMMASHFAEVEPRLERLQAAAAGPVEGLRLGLLQVQFECATNRLPAALATAYRALDRNYGDRLDAVRSALLSGDLPSSAIAEQIADKAAATGVAPLALLLTLAATPAAFYTSSRANEHLCATQLAVSLVDGPCENTAIALCNYAASRLAQGDFANALAIAALIEQSVQRFPDPLAALRAQVLRNAFFDAWTAPLDQVIGAADRLRVACQSAGDYPFAAYAGVFQAERQLFASRSLAQSLTLCEQLADFTGRILMQVPHYQIQIWHQLLANLQSAPARGSAWEGGIFSESALSQSMLRDNNEMSLYFLYFAKALQGLHFGDDAALADAVGLARRYRQASGATHSGLWFDALEAVAEAQAGRVPAAAASLERLRRAAGCARPGVAHLLPWARAECALARGDAGGADKQYAAACAAAQAAGSVHDSCLFAERWALALRHRGERQRAAAQLRVALDGWRQWGAGAKVDYLRALVAEG